MPAGEGGFEELEPDEFDDVYAYLRRVAEGELSRRRVHGHWASSIANRALLKLLASRTFAARDAEHLRRVGVKAIKEVLADVVRHENAAKRGGGRAQIAISEMKDSLAAPDSAERAYIEMLLDRIPEFAELYPDAGPLVELVLLGGCAPEEAARMRGVLPEVVEAALVLFRDFVRRRGAG